MDLRYPIGKFVWPTAVRETDRGSWIQDIAEAPAKLRESIAGLSERQLDASYRPEGWTVREVVHHVPDSHLISYTRFKFALTEDNPTIKAYPEDLWAKLPDSRGTPIETSLVLLEALHGRWVILLRALNGEQWARTFQHPEIGLVKLEHSLALYSWHGKHHTAHITALRQRMGW